MIHPRPAPLTFEAPAPSHTSHPFRSPREGWRSVSGLEGLIRGCASSAGATPPPSWGAWATGAPSRQWRRSIPDGGGCPAFGDPQQDGGAGSVVPRPTMPSLMVSWASSPWIGHAARCGLRPSRDGAVGGRDALGGVAGESPRDPRSSSRTGVPHEPQGRRRQQSVGVAGRGHTGGSSPDQPAESCQENDMYICRTPRRDCPLPALPGGLFSVPFERAHRGGSGCGEEGV